jgi:hypothetical protein
MFCEEAVNCRLPIADFQLKEVGQNWQLEIGNWK